MCRPARFDGGMEKTEKKNILPVSNYGDLRHYSIKTNTFMSANTKTRLIAYWITTGLLCTGMFAGGIAQMIHAKPNADGMIHLGYPLYVMTILGFWKILGVGVLLAPGLKLFKEWAYAGFFFLMTGAVVSHLASGDGVAGVIAQCIFVLLIVASWYLRPENRVLTVSK